MELSLAILIVTSILAMVYHLTVRNRHRNTVEEFPDKGYNVVYNEYSGSVVITDEVKFNTHLKKLHDELLADLRKQGIFL